jgi:hypothetical protein
VPVETGAAVDAYGCATPVGARAAMRKTLKLVLYAALILFVGLPLAFVLFVAGMSIFGVVVGIGFGILGFVITVLKFALMVVLPIALLVWVAKRLLAPDRSY